MKGSYYILLLLLFFNYNIIADDFITAINHPNKKYEFGHWVIYEMNIGSFTSDGTFNAAKDKLLSLKDLGIDIIWLMPIYERDNREAESGINSPYAAKNFMNPNPYYGTLSDLKSFVNKAHEYKMQVWFDWVAAHTANNNPWLTDHRDYYMTPLHGAYADVSRLNYTNPEVQRVMTSILKYWIDTADIDGFRVDYISSDDVPNEYWIKTIPELKSHKPGKTITMLGEADFTDKQRFFYTFWDYDYAWGFQEGSLYKDMINFPTDAGKLKYHCENIVNDNRYADLDRMTYLTNHDVNFNDGGNSLTKMYGDNKYGFTVLIFTLYGMPLIFNSQEIGGDQILDYFWDTKIDWTTNRDNKMYNTIRTLTAMKHSVNAFRDGKNKEERGTVIWIHSWDGVAAYIRRNENCEALVVLNLGSATIDVTLNGVTEGNYIKWLDSATITTGVSQQNVYLDSNPTIHLEQKGYHVYVFQGIVSKCPPGSYLDNTDCINKMIKLNHFGCRAGHFARNKKGDLIIEYSGDPQIEKRLFYGFDKYGRGFFDDEYIKEKNLPNTFGRYEGRNIFVSKITDTNKEKEYLLSISSRASLTELHDLENDAFLTRNSDDFNEKRIFSLVYSILEYNNYYYLIFTTPGDTSDTENGEYYAIKKFAFNDFDLEHYDNSKPIKMEQKFGDRVITGLIMEEANGNKVILIYFLNQLAVESEIRAKYTIRFYTLDLEIIGDDLHNYNDPMKKNTDIIENYGVFSNPIILKDQLALFIFYYVNKGVSKLVFHCFSFKRNEAGTGFEIDWSFNFHDDFTHRFDNDITLNDVHKISDDRLVIVTTRNSGTSLFIIILDFFGSYDRRIYRLYNYKIFPNYKIKKDLAVYSHQNFLILSSTIGPTSTEQPYSSILLFFSYPNGTDFDIDISLYLQGNDNYDNTQNLFTFLMSKLNMENNIFHLEIVQKIKLTKIPEGMLFYNANDNTLLTDGDFLENNYALKQNTNKIKTSEVYYLYYQYVAKEPSYDKLYNFDIEVIKGGNKIFDDYRSYYTAKEYYGRANKLSFTLCHNYCATCKSLGISNDDQHCESCLPTYSYDYLANKNDFTGNCVPSGEMYDKELHKLLKCEDHQHKYYLNTSEANKKYCFKYAYDCPESYPNLNTVTNECYYIPPKPSTFQDTTTIPSTNKEKIKTNAPEEVEIAIPSTNKEKIKTNTPEEVEIAIPSTNKEKIKTNTPEEVEIAIPSTNKEKILTNVPGGISTDFPKNEMQTIIGTSPIISYNCSYQTFEHSCVFLNLTDEQIHDKIKKELITTYPKEGGEGIIVSGSGSYSFEIIDSLKGKDIYRNKKGNVMDLGECEQTLKSIYQIDSETAIIILKYYKLEGNSNEKKIQYELYHPKTYEKLNLSYCENNTYELYIPIDMEGNIANILSKAKEQGYNLLDPNDPFYSKICTRYTSESGTDVLLDDRVSFYFNKVANFTSCPENCKFISYSSETHDLKCECGFVDTDISTLDLEHITTKKTAKALLDTLKYSNYKVMRCYNLVFNFTIFKTNIGSILTLIFFIVYLSTMILYIIKDLRPLKVSIAKVIFIGNSDINDHEKVDIHNKKLDIESPPKKRKQNNSVVINSEMNKKVGKFDFSESNHDKKNKQKIKDYLNQKDAKKINKHMTKSVIDSNNQMLSISKFNMKSTKNSDQIQSDDNLLNNKNKKKQNKDELISEIVDNKSDFETLSLKSENFDDFELNNLDYIPACDYDKRSFIKTYWSVLKREHIGIMTFLAWNDYNIFYIKLNRLIIQFCTSFTMNGLFFSDESMHYLYVNNGEYSFVQKIPQMVFSLLIGHIIEVFLCYLSLTDTPIYVIKELARNKTTENKKKIFQIIKCIRKKLIIFNVFTFLLFLFYWYFISAFCAVYHNTQKVFIRDSLTSFLTAMLDPFVIYAITSIIRVISLLRCFKKKVGFIYGISQILPLF